MAQAALAANAGVGGGGAGGRKKRKILNPRELNDAAFADSPISLLAVRKAATNALRRLLSGIESPKALVLDPDLVGPLAFIMPFSEMKELGVAQIHKLGSDELRESCDRIVYLCRPRYYYMRLINRHIQAFEDRVEIKRYHVVSVPRDTVLCRQAALDRGFADRVERHEFRLDLIPLDSDTLTLAQDASFRDLFLDGETSLVYTMANALLRLQAQFGIIPNIKAKGAQAVAVSRLMRRLLQEQGEDTIAHSIVPEIDTVVILDRDVDPVTPMLTQRTYEGLLDEIFRFNMSMIEVSKDLLGKDHPHVLGTRGDTVKEVLNNGEPVFKSMRNQCFEALGAVSRDWLRHYQEVVDQKQEVGKSTEAFRRYVKMIGPANEARMATQMHINLADACKQEKTVDRVTQEMHMLTQSRVDDAVRYIETAIACLEPMERVLRLLCLLCLTCPGVKQKQIDNLKREFLQSYGYEQLLVLLNLEKAGLLPGTGDVRPQRWPKLVNLFRLFREGLRLQDPAAPRQTEDKADLNYTYSGYAPLSARLVELAALRGGWAKVQPMLDLVPGPMEEVSQDVPKDLISQLTLLQSPANPDRRPLVTLVVFMGGCTRSEICALRRLEQRDEQARRYLVATTQICTGSDLIAQLREQFKDGLKERRTA